MLKFIIALVSLSSIIQAAQFTLTEESVIELAKKRNENIGISRQELNQAKEKVDAAQSSLFPVLSLSAGIQKATGEGNFMPQAYDWNRNARVQLTQPIYTFGKISNSIDVTRSAHEISELNTIATQAEVIAVARQLYYQILYNGELVKITESSYKNAQANKKALEDRVSYGRISRNDNLKMQTDLASRKPQLITAKKSLENSILDLKNFLAIDQEDKVRVIKASAPEKLQFKKIDNELTKLNETVDIKILKENMKLTQSSIDLAKSQRLPDFSLFATYAPLNYRDSFSGEILREQNDLTVGLSFTFDWPFGGSKNSDVAVQKSQYRITQMRLKQMKRDIQTRYLKLEREHKSLLEKLEAEKQAVSLAISSYKVALSSFRSGGISQLQLNDSELQLRNNRLAQAQTNLQIQLLDVEMERLLTDDNRKR